MFAQILIALCAFTSVRAQTPGSIRLTGSISSSFGRLEIFYNLQWGTICNNNFTSVEATVACRELGYYSVDYYNSTSFKGYHTSSSSQPIWLDNVRCSRSSTAISNCSNSGLGVNNCPHSQDVVIGCSSSSVVTSIIIPGSSGNISSSTTSSVAVVVSVVILVCVLIIGCVVGVCVVGVCVCVCLATAKHINRNNRYPSHAQGVVLAPTATSNVTMTNSTATNQQPGYPLENIAAADAPPIYSQLDNPPQDQASDHPPQEKADGYYPPQDQAN